MDPLDQQAEIICPEEQVYSFAFIQEEAEWLDGADCRQVLYDTDEVCA